MFINTYRPVACKTLSTQKIRLKSEKTSESRHSYTAGFACKGLCTAVKNKSGQLNRPPHFGLIRLYLSGPAASGPMILIEKQ